MRTMTVVQNPNGDIFSMMNECADAKIIWEKLSNGDTEEKSVSVLNSFGTIHVIIISTIRINIKITNYFVKIIR